MFQGQECFKSLGFVLNSKKLKFKSFPEFGCIVYPFSKIDYLDEIAIDLSPSGIEEGKHIWDFRHNIAGWTIEKLSRHFTNLTLLFALKQEEHIKRKMEKIWITKENYKKSSIFPFEILARITTSIFCDKGGLKHIFGYFKDERTNQIIEVMGKRKDELERMCLKLIGSLVELDMKLSKNEGVSFFDWQRKMNEVETVAEATGKKMILRKIEHWKVFILPVIYSLNPQSIRLKISLAQALQLINIKQLHPLPRLFHAIRVLEKLSTREISSLNLRGIRRKISTDFENFSYYDSVKSEQEFTLNEIKNIASKAIPLPLASLLSLETNPELCKDDPIIYLGVPVSIYKYKYRENLNRYRLDLTVYSDNPGEYLIKVKNDPVGKDFLDQLYLASLGENILNDKRECPMKGSNYELKCDNCTLFFAKKLCKNLGYN